MTEQEYLDWLTIDCIIQMSKGVEPKDCEVRFTKEDVEAFLDESKLH
jgi:hypothetical protein